MATQEPATTPERPTPEEPMPAEPGTMPEQEPETAPEPPTMPEDPDADPSPSEPPSNRPYIAARFNDSDEQCAGAERHSLGGHIGSKIDVR